MLHKLYWYLLVICVLLLAGCGAGGSTGVPLAAVTQTATSFPVEPPASCPITTPAGLPFTPPAPYPAAPPANYAGQFWYGTPELWTLLREDGTWSALPLSSQGYTQKIFWWREGYDMLAEPEPKLTVTGKRLDAQAPALIASSATNAKADLGEGMLVGVEVPTPGCWEITGLYNGQTLSFVVWVVP